MNDKIFVDSNVFIYLFDSHGRKKEIAKTILATHPVISVQVVSENMNVLFKKFRDQLTDEQIKSHKQRLLKNCTVTDLSSETLDIAFEIKLAYVLQWYDSLILAAALEADCSILYSEDMQHGLLVDNSLRIINPFV